MSARYDLITKAQGGTLMSPYGASGPQYNAIFSSGANIGGTGFGTDQWMQGLLDPYAQARTYDLTRQQALSGDAAKQQQTLNSGGAVLAANGLYVNPATGAPFNGFDRVTGRTYVGGRPTTETVPYSGGKQINPNDPYQRYEAINITKNPALEPATQTMIEQFNKTATASLPNFSEIKKTFTGDLSAARAASSAATDIAPTVGTLQGAQDRYIRDLEAAKAAYAALNPDVAKNLRGVVTEAERLLPTYDTAAQNAANLQLQALQRNVSRYKAASGTPMGLGSAEQGILTRGAANILVPMEQAKIAQRYNILSQYKLPVELDIANRETHRIGTFNPAIAAQEFASGQATAQTIQQLKNVTAQMAYNDAIKYMQAIGVPELLQQQIVAGNISNYSALQQAVNANRYQGLQDVMGAQITPSQSYNWVPPGYPTDVSRYQPMYPEPTASPYVAGGVTVDAPPKQIYPGSSLVRNPVTGKYYNKETGMPSTYSDAAPGRYAPLQYGGSRGENPWYYDYMTERFINRATGESQPGPVARWT